MQYAIKINGGYFKEYVYHELNRTGRFAGIGHNSTLKDGDIVDIVITKEPEFLWPRRGIGNTISILYGIESLRDKEINIIPIRR